MFHQRFCGNSKVQLFLIFVDKKLSETFVNSKHQHNVLDHLQDYKQMNLN